MIQVFLHFHKILKNHVEKFEGEVEIGITPNK